MRSRSVTQSYSSLYGNFSGMDLLTDLLLIESKADRYESMMKARSPPASLQFIGQVTEHTTVKWSIETNLTRYQVLVTRCLADPTSKKHICSRTNYDKCLRSEIEV